MKKLLFPILLSMFAVSSVVAQNTAKPMHAWKFVVGPESKQSALDSVCKAWKKDGIDMTITDTKYTNGVLVDYTINVSYKGVKGTGTPDAKHPSTLIMITDMPSVKLEGK